MMNKEQLTKSLEQSNHKGSRLEEFWLDSEAGKLHPAEQKLLDCVARGEMCEIAAERPTIATRENTIRASFLRFLILGGDKNAPVHARGLRISGVFVHCDNRQRCLDLDGAKVDRDVGIWNSLINGSILFRNATAAMINLQGSSIFGLNGDRLNLRAGLLLRDGFTASETIQLSGANIGGNLECDNAAFLDNQVAILGDGAKIGGSVFLRDGFAASGTVRLPGAKIGGNLECTNGYFNAEHQAILAPNIQIGGNLYLDDGFQARGEVDFRNAKIGGNVRCSKAIFSCKNQSLVFNRATINGMVLLGQDLLSAGQISFSGTKIGRDMSVQGVSLEGRPSLQLRNAEITGTLTWRGIKYARGLLDLAGASCRDFSFDEQSWQKPKEIKLTNFTYKSFTELPKDADGEFWCAWLSRQPSTHLRWNFRPKPFEYLASVLSDMGYEEEARAVRIEKQRRQTDFLQYHQPKPKRPSARLLRSLSIFWRRAVLAPLVDYGYRPGKAGLYLIAISLLGTMIYWWAGYQGIMTPTNALIYKEAQLEGGTISVECAKNWVYQSNSCSRAMPSEYSEFQPFWYSADVLLPLVDLRQQQDWSPRVVHADGSSWWAGRFVRWWEWFEIFAGWLLSLLLVSAIGGIIRR